MPAPAQPNQPNQGQPNQPTNQSNQQSPSGTTTSAASTISRIPASAPAGLLTITQPPQTATSFYKIAPSNFVTFGWNFSYIIATPTHLTVSAVCENGNTYPVGPTDGVIPGTATEIVWDIYSYQQNHPNTPLAQATYTLNIWDDRGPGAARAPGYLQANSGLKFALYNPQGYTGLADANPLLVSLIATFIIMLISGFGLLRHWR
ncbi:hypothetical protein LshimejAT787_0603900 [Lyophyllum shimeji]|uniref:DUF7137 domain-containing protein n=1 Tax=Lyophyllum shimeji TaxID=47721 RepID=A0A9P3PPK3_LYOSH|nr:hypothetical protein LshimejAT787_0603900 [Lyophyllum shimeji]